VFFYRFFHKTSTCHMEAPNRARRVGILQQERRRTFCAVRVPALWTDVLYGQQLRSFVAELVPNRVGSPVDGGTDLTSPISSPAYPVARSTRTACSLWGRDSPGR
jgi:hypothetical protein